jgi:hypothetical protein
MAKAKTAGTPLMEFGVDFGNVSVGDKTCRIKVSTGRKAVTLSRADKDICERRLTGTILAKPAGWRSDDQALPGMDEDTTIDGSFDVKGVSFTTKALSFGLTFNVNDVDVSRLATFAQRSGRLIVNEVGPLTDGEEEESDEE